MQKIYSFIISTIFLLLTVICLQNRTFGMVNPWIDCAKDFQCASKKAGFDFPLKVKIIIQEQ